MEHLVKTMAPPIGGILLGELKDWETKGVNKVMCSFPQRYPNVTRP